MAGLQYGEGCIMIDSVVWAQFINVTDSHVAIATNALRRAAGINNKSHKPIKDTGK